VCSAHAESFPDDHETNTFIRSRVDGALTAVGVMRCLGRF